MLRVLLILFAAKTLGDATFYDGYDPKTPLNVQVIEQSQRPEYAREVLTFESYPGVKVPTIFTKPLNAADKVPCIVFLHGIGQNKSFLDEICAPFNKAGFAMVSFDQLMQGERRLPKDAGYLTQGKAFRRRAAATVIDTRRLIDYLLTRPDIDPNRLFLVGASYGAITGSTVAAFDERLKAIVLIYGGGDIPTLLSAPMITEEVGPAIKVLAPIVSYILDVADPLHYIGQIKDRPVLFQNGSRDRLVDPRAGKKLQNACKAPKEITWYDSDHIGFDMNIVLLVLDEALNWLRNQAGMPAAA